MRAFGTLSSFDITFGCLLVWILFKSISAQCPAGSSVTFEKLSNVNIRGVNLVPLYTGQQENLPVSAECNNRCRAASNCRAFIINYSKHSCVGIGYDSEANGLSMVPTNERTSYFDKICLKGHACEKAWTFERVIGKQLLGFDDRIVPAVPNRLRCQEMCLKEREFLCKSGEYEHGSQICRLSREDRRSQPLAFVNTSASTDYFENQCAHSPSRLQQANLVAGSSNNSTMNSSKPTNGTSHLQSASRLAENEQPTSDQCAFKRMPAIDLKRADLLRPAASEANCEQLCRTTKAFVCRSFTYEPHSKKCWLNSDDSISAGGPSSLVPTPARLYFERTDCANLRLSCTTNAMEVELHTLQPFNGRLYAREQPNRCETMARGNTSNRLRLPLPADDRAEGECGVRRESDGRYSAVVVVQQHPLVQRKGDRLVRVVCSVHGHSQVVSSGYQLLTPPPDNEHALSGEPATTLVNGSAPAAHVQLRITDANGNDVMGARLGQQLQLRIERSDASEALHMQATHLLAMSSSGNQQIALIDSDGCPTDANIFPSLETTSDGRTLIGKFDAFKFADDQVVRFRVNVHFCVGPCKAFECDASNDAKPNLDETSGTSGLSNENEIHSGKLNENDDRTAKVKHDRRPLNDRSITIESTSDQPVIEDAQPEESNTGVSFRAAVARLFNRRKRSENSNRVQSIQKRSGSMQSLSKSKASALRTPADAELKREIIVQGLSNNNDDDSAAKLLYNQSLDDDLCVSRGSLLVLGMTAALFQILLILLCCICCSRKKSTSIASPSLPSHTSYGRCKVTTDTWSAGSGRRPLPAQLSRYFNRID